MPATRKTKVAAANLTCTGEACACASGTSSVWIGASSQVRGITGRNREFACWACRRGEKAMQTMHARLSESNTPGLFIGASKRRQRSRCDHLRPLSVIAKAVVAFTNGGEDIEYYVGQRLITGVGWMAVVLST